MINLCFGFVDVIVMVKFVVLLVLFFSLGCSDPSLKNAFRGPDSEMASGGDIGVEGSSPVQPSLPGLSGNSSFFEGCSDILTKNGVPGPLGRELVRAMKKVEAEKKVECFSASSNETLQIGKYCKGNDHYNALSEAEQQNLWLWFWASFAQIETSCSEMRIYSSREHPIKQNGEFLIRDVTADKERIEYGGMFLLPNLLSNRSQDNQDFCGSVADHNNYRFQADCAVSRIADLFCGSGILSGVASKKRLAWYGWESLGNQPRVRSMLLKLFKQHPFCQ